MLLLFFLVSLTLLTPVVIQWLQTRTHQPSNSRRPDGPKGKLLIGNLFDIPPHHWLQFKKWADQYGPIFRLNFAGREAIVVSKESIANDLLRERGGIYSGREPSVMALEIVSHHLRPLLIPNNDTWRRGRRLMHRLMSITAVYVYKPVQSFESLRAVRDLIAEPENYEHWFERYTAAVIFRIGYGQRVMTGNEPYVQRILQVGRNLEKVAAPGAYLVDTFKWLRHLPELMAPFKKEGREMHQAEVSIFSQLIDDVRRDLKNGTAPESFTKTYLEENEFFGLSDDEGMYVIGTLFAAALHTTTSALASFCQAMVLHPEWQREAQDEIDDQLQGRMPEFEDMPKLPTLRAVLKETLRWRPVTAGGLPHQLVQDDVYNGFYFPAGTNVHPNQWAIHRDPDLYPSGDAYLPSRWLDPTYPTYKGPLTTHPNLNHFSAFGFGRRICPGIHVAENTMLILIARLIWACTLSKKLDESGKEIDVKWYDVKSGGIAKPKRFEFAAKERGRGRLEMIENMEAQLEGIDTARFVNSQDGYGDEATQKEEVLGKMEG